MANTFPQTQLGFLERMIQKARTLGITFLVNWAIFSSLIKISSEIHAEKKIIFCEGKTTWD